MLTWVGGGITLFNPFHTLAAQWPLASLDYTFRFSGGKDGDSVQSVHLEPKPYATRTKPARVPIPVTSSKQDEV